MFTSGVYLNFDGKDTPLTSNNSQSALTQPEIVTSKLQNELSKGRIAGPFNNPPLPNFKSSPLALREKQEQGKYRLLRNLSYPYDLSSVNSNIPTSASTVKYERLSDAIKDIQECTLDAHMAKSDIADAFRLIPLHPSQYHLTGFSWEHKYYYDKCLPQGSASSCRIFETFSTALKWILNNKLGVKRVTKVLDDFFFADDTELECSAALSSFIYLCQELRVPIAQHKTAGPSQVITFLGIELDTHFMIARLPTTKLDTYREDIQNYMTHDKVTLRELKSIIGKLQFATTVVKPGRPFLRRLYDLTMQATKPHHYIRLTKSVKQDLDTWFHFLQHYNGITMIRCPSHADSHSVHLFTDASKTAFGGTYGTFWIQGTWPEAWKSEDITVLELYPIYLIVCMFKQKIANSDITFHCDNSAICAIINKQTSKHKTIMNIVRPLVLTLLLHNITFRARHIPGVHNTLSDAISRLQVTPEMLRHYGMRPLPTTIPEPLKPENFRVW